jgi:UDP-N-acetylmuramate dehydrogenase
MITENINILPYNTFGISVQVEKFAPFSSVEELKELLSQKPNDFPFMILGGGSNILFTQNFAGLILKNEILGFEIVKKDGDSVFVKAGAGENWHSFVLRTIGLNLGGLENLSLIPGNVGASPMQNIGAYGREVKDVFHSLEAYHIESGEIHTFFNEECEFGYRESVFKRKLKNQYVILNVTYKLSKKHQLNTSYGAIEDELRKMDIEHPTIKDVSNAVIAIRGSKLPNPKEIGNAGSFFKNPVIPTEQFEKLKSHYSDMPSYPSGNDHVKLAAGWLIEKAGWKGKTFETYGVHKLQALVLVNYGGATGNQLFNLSEQIIKDIEEKFGVTLEREVNII